MKPVIKVLKGGSTFVGKTMKFASEKYLKSHTKHLGKFGLDNLPLNEGLQKYEKMAADFFQSEGDDIIRYARGNGEVVQYDKTKNIFGVAKGDGTIRTFMKPDGDGIEYFKNNAVQDLGDDAAKVIDGL